MLPLRTCRSLLIRVSLQPKPCLWSVPLRHKHTRFTRIRRVRIKRPVLEEVQPKNSRSIPQDRNVPVPLPEDSAEVTALKAQLFDLVNERRRDLENVPDLRKIYETLASTKTIFGKALVDALTSSVCRAIELSNGLLSKDPALAENAEFQQRRNDSLLLLDKVVAHYKQGRFQANGYVPARILLHYNSREHFDAALDLWNWLCRMREEGHVDYRVYAARIAIAEKMGEGYHACEALYEEAIAKLGDELSNYHLSHNAVLSEPHLPLEQQVRSAGPLLRTMFGVRLRYGDWKTAYLTLDTQLRIEVESLHEAAKLEILANQSTWEAFHVENLATFTQGVRGSRRSVVSDWLDMLMEDSSHIPQSTAKVNPLRLYSVACAILRALEERLFVGPRADTSKDKLSSTEVDRELCVLWDSWFTLCFWHGGKHATESPSSTHQDPAAMKEFIASFLERMQMPLTTKLKLRMKKNIKLIRKQEPDPELAAISGEILGKLRRQINKLQDINNSSVVAVVPTIPHWNSLLTREDMMGLYKELGLSGSSTTTDDRQASDAEGASDSEQQLAEDQLMAPDFHYETRTGMRLEEARFQSWMAVNHMYLVADEFERNSCLHWQAGEQRLTREAGIRQAEVLEKFDPEMMNGEDGAEHKEILLNRVRRFRQHQGMLHSGF